MKVNVSHGYTNSDSVYVSFSYPDPVKEVLVCLTEQVSKEEKELLRNFFVGDLFDKATFLHDAGDLHFGPVEVTSGYGTNENGAAVYRFKFSSPVFRFIMIFDEEVLKANGTSLNKILEVINSRDCVLSHSR